MALGKRPAEARETKGERTRKRIVEEALALVEEQGIAAVSQENVARRAGLSQSALRHHFPVKDDMLGAIFGEAFRSFYIVAERELLKPESAPRDKLMQLIVNHLDYVLTSSDRIALEAFSFSTRNATMLADQSAWYHWLVAHYASLLGAIHPALDAGERNARALAILSLCLGVWISAGKSRPLWPGQSRDETRTALLGQIARLIDGD